MTLQPAAPVTSPPGSSSRGEPAADGPRLTDADFERLREFVYRRTGIQFTPNKRYFVDKRVLAQMTAYGTEDFGRYLAALRMGDERLIEQLVNELTVNETYFLREDYQFDVLLRRVLPDVMRDRRAKGTSGGPVRILSLPSSTGEEPYSIAIRLLEEWPDIAEVDVTLTAADIDTRVLEAARQGVYGSRSLQRVPPALLGRYFAPAGDGLHRISAELRDAVGFRQVNLCDPQAMSTYQDYDVVFCRNLLIYFDELSSRTAAENLYNALRPGGFLFLGHSESMSRISPIFTRCRYAETLVYQRPEAGERR